MEWPLLLSELAYLMGVIWTSVEMLGPFGPAELGLSPEERSGQRYAFQHWAKGWTKRPRKPEFWSDGWFWFFPIGAGVLAIGLGAAKLWHGHTLPQHLLGSLMLLSGVLLAVLVFAYARRPADPSS